MSLAVNGFLLGMTLERLRNNGLNTVNVCESD